MHPPRPPTPRPINLPTDAIVPDARLILAGAMNVVNRSAALACYA